MLFVSFVVRVRWVYLDIGKFGGLAETMDKSIRYAIRTPHDGAEMRPCGKRSCRRSLSSMAAASSADSGTGLRLEPVQGSQDLRLPIIVAALDRGAQRLAGEIGAERAKIVEILQGDRRDREAALPFEMDEPLRGKPRECLAQRRDADAVTRAQLAKGQPLARL